MQIWITVTNQTLCMRVTRISLHFVTLTDHLVGAKSFRAACRVFAVRVFLTLVVAIQKVGTSVLCTAARITLEVVIASVVNDFLAV